MYPPLLFHLVTSALLLCSTLIIIFAKTNKKVKAFSMFNRFFYLIFLITGLLLARYTFANHFILTIFKIILAFGLIICLEILAASKTQTHLSKKFLFLIFILFMLVCITGFILHNQF
ncbi:DUF1516 family protein [Periweissella beninensis]|uniref:DUF1516 family protein n=1 Tax=Periweissella beninensis TaxID=504936 RepID=UPI0035D454ED|nr:DUF1516 family protein [Periweissella beninensis]